MGSVTGVDGCGARTCVELPSLTSLLITEAETVEVGQCVHVCTPDRESVLQYAIVDAMVSVHEAASLSSRDMWAGHVHTVCNQRDQAIILLSAGTAREFTNLVSILSYMQRDNDGTSKS